MAQCQGRTRKGEQCKRDAGEGSAFCSIHLDQAVRAPKAKEAAEWDRDSVVKAAVGFALVGAILFFGFRR
ncbi:MAG TPA: hypothetical protein VJ997_13850 [Longimicrobiales bacterium]|nr:hypothetical protein [Longimicrobiales bacterium]